MNAPPLAISHFTNKSGAGLVERNGTWPEFCAWVENLPPQPVKDQAPLIKFARFGSDRTTKGSLRHDDNVIEVTGIEGDYDDEVIPPDEAIARLERAGIRALVVTTHSHTPEKPRWRVFAPLSAAVAPAERMRLTGRLNGALYGCLARESFTLSQSFFVGGKPGGEYRVLTTFDDPEDGEFVDLIDTLDALAKFPADTPAGKGGKGSAGPRKSDDVLLAELLTGDAVHPNACVIVARMVADGINDAAIRAVFAVLADQVEAARGKERADTLRGKELDDLIAGAHQKGFAPVDPQAAYLALQERIDQADETELDALAVAIAEARLSRTREELLLKRMGKRFGLTLRALRADLMSEKYTKSEDGKDHLMWAREVIKHLGEGDALFAQATFWRWDASGVWVRADDREVKQAAHTTIGEGDAVTRALVDGITDIVKTELFAAVSPFDREDWARVNVANGTLRLIGGAWQLDPHNRADYLTTQLPVPYDPQAQCPRFAQFLQEIFEGDHDAREKARCVLEAIGYTLLTTCRFEKFFLLIGSGANGKSVLLGVLEALIGPRYVCAVQPSQFDNRFQRAHLHGRLANIVTEIAEGAEIADAQLKALVSGELTTAEHKMKPPFDFRPFATCWFGTNHMPHTRDFSDALFRRAIVLTFNRKFYGKDRDPHLKDKLLAELPGILAVSLRAIAGVMQRGEFTIPASSMEAAREWRTEADQVAQFVEEACVVGAGLKVPSSEVYSAYQAWALSSGIRRTLNRKNFTQRLERLGMQAGRTGAMRIIHGVAVRAMEAYA
ncbi:phage/plasmid primase, P4 family [Thauera chlorobenzoica]|uniref:Virulence associated protein n=1 Tax=Thauera chlorobenzoica TaxID=96773 RepID=A0A1H5UB16_9RHOO|nr:DNA primase family protein [Thauera chlorobenzoica]APR03798.1 virulence associated protein [Thauera chlorobenzoica]SEF71618.1 phage/plasmid primase, P4 family, C-terminal domain-containing protein [Thauera chlorobenzoica]